MRGGEVRQVLGFLALGSLLCLLPLAQARASYDPLASGTATISLSGPFRSLLHQQHVKLTGRKGARVIAQRRIVLPVAGGKADPTIAKGSFELGGEVVLSSAGHSLALTFLTINTKSSPLYAKVGGGQQKVAKAKGASFLRDGFAYGYKATGLTLSAKTATRLGKRLKLEGVEAGQTIGSLKVTANPATVTVLPKGRATFVLDPAFAAKLSALFVARNPIFPAEHQGDTFTLPIGAKGQLAPDGSAGTLRIEGTLELLQLGAGQLFWRELWFQPDQTRAIGEAELDPSPPYPGKRAEAGIFSLGSGQITSDPSARTIAISGAPLTLTALTAQDLNEGFSRPQEKGDLFAAGEAAGTISFTAQGQ
jgi:hypothetical protein